MPSFLLAALICLQCNKGYAQSWSFIDSGGDYGINTSSLVNNNQPKTVVFNDELYVIWYENSTHGVHIKKYNPTTGTWTGVGATSGETLLCSTNCSLINPQIVVYNGAIYVAFEEVNDYYDNSGIKVMCYNGSTWSSCNTYSTFPGNVSSRYGYNINYYENATASCPSLSVYNNKLYAAWVEARNVTAVNQIRVSEFNGTGWTIVDGNNEYGLNYNVAQNVQYDYNTELAVYDNI
jgi:hypothetical protein